MITYITTYTLIGLITGISLAFDVSLMTQFALPKLLILRVGTLALCLIWLKSQRQGLLQPLSRPVLAGVVFGIWQIVASFGALHGYTALHGIAGWYNGLWTQLNYLLIFYLVAVLSIDRLKVLKTFVCVMSVVAVYAILQNYKLDFALYSFLKLKTAILFFDVKPSSTIGNPVTLAVCQMLALPFSIYFAIKSKGLKSVFWIVLSILFLLTIILTQARAVVLAMVAASLILMFVYGWRHFTKRGLLYVIINFLLLAAVSLAVLFTLSSPATQNRWNPNKMLQDDTVKLRIIYAKTAYKMLTDKPIRILTGIGLDNLFIAYPLYRSTEAINLEPNSMPTQTHNSYLNYALTGGLPLLIFYLAFIGAVFKNINRNDRLLGITFTASILMFLLQDFTGWATIPTQVFFYIIMGLAVKNETS